MKEITINGVSYLPAAALAKQFRYTTDYIGQLCRAKKVDAQLVGRSWYVNPLSLTAHKTGRYTKPVATPSVAAEVQLPEEAATRLEVLPATAKKTARVAAFAPQHFAKRIEWKPLKYEADEGDLLPRVVQKTSSQKITVDLADSTDIPIKNTSKHTILEAEELPTVSLRGSIAVASIEEAFEIEEEKFASVPVPEPDQELGESAPRAKKEFVHNTLPSKADVLRKKVQKQAQPKASAGVPVVSPFTPATVLEIDGQDEGVGIIRITLATTGGVLALLLALVFFTENTITADATAYEWGIDFSGQSLLALLGLFSQ